MSARYAFAPLREEDLPLVRQWLLEPHVKKWWDDGSTSRYPDGQIEEYREAIQGKDPSYHYLAAIDGRAVGMFQHYRIGDDAEYAEALALTEDAIGVDLFIGDEKLIGLGHGPKMLRGFLRDIAFPFHHIDVCVIGPSVRNLAAIRAYEKIGFRALREVRVPDEPDPEFLMRITSAELNSL